MSLHTFPSYITTDGCEIEVTVSIDHYYPGTPDTIHGPGDDEELIWHFIADDGTPAPILHTTLTRDDSDRIDAECVHEMEGLAREARTSARIDAWIERTEQGY